MYFSKFVSKLIQRYVFLHRSITHAQILYPVACRVKEYMERSISTLPSPFFCFLSAAFTNIYPHIFCAMYALESLEYIIFTGI